MRQRPGNQSANHYIDDLVHDTFPAFAGLGRKAFYIGFDLFYIRFYVILFRGLGSDGGRDAVQIVLPCLQLFNPPVAPLNH